LRNLLRKGERKIELVDINELVQSTVALLNSELIGRDIEIETSSRAPCREYWAIRSKCSRCS
jgi:hypothetical protein